MNTQVSLEIQGMFCAQCAVKLERALTRRDGVIGACVNYASQRAAVVYESSRVGLGELVGVIREQGFEVSLAVTSVPVSDLVYATHPHSVESILRRNTGAVQVAADLAGGRITFTTLSADAGGDAAAQAIRLGFHIGAAGIHTATRFLARSVILSAAAIALGWIALFQWNTSLGGDGHELGWMTLAAALVTLGAGFPFYRHGAAMLLCGKLDRGVLLGLVTFISFLAGVALTQLNPLDWSWGAWGAFMFASALTTGWFLVRAGSVWFFPHWQNEALSKRQVTRTPWLNLGRKSSPRLGLLGRSASAESGTPKASDSAIQQRW